MTVRIQREDDRSAQPYASVPIAFEVFADGDASTLRPGSAIQFEPDQSDLDKGSDADPARFARLGKVVMPIDKWVCFAAYSEKASGSGCCRCDRPRWYRRCGGRHNSQCCGMCGWPGRASPQDRKRVLEVEVVAREAGCRRVEVETQDINVAACRLYAAHHFAVHRHQPGSVPRGADGDADHMDKGILSSNQTRVPPPVPPPSASRLPPPASRYC